MQVDRLPQLDGGLFLTDGGIETTLIFHRGIDLPLFAAFALLDDEQGRETLRDYYEPYLRAGGRARGRVRARERDLACEPALGAGARLLAGASSRPEPALDRAAGGAARRASGQASQGPIVISGCIGPAGRRLPAEPAALGAGGERYHATQIETFAAAGADLVTAITMTYADEAIGIARAAAAAACPR